MHSKPDFSKADERLTRQIPRDPGQKSGDEGGPSKPDVRKPDGGNELLRRMKKVDPDQAKRYRQRSGQ
jgi:hypothetical protein